MPSPDAPLSGRCACGTVRFQVVGPFTTAGYCHCHRCQQRSGTLFSVNGVVDGTSFELLAGAEAVGSWEPEGGLPKMFCRQCGGAVFGGYPGQAGRPVTIRLGALEGDPEVRPQWHQWLESAPDWAPVAEDGLPRWPRRREAG